MAELPALRSPASPQLFGRAHSYGVAGDLERLRHGQAPAPRLPRIPTRTRRRRRRQPGRVRQWWAANDLRPVDLWHCVRCRTGHHDLGGGYRLRCVWCDTEPPA
jgi:hypothetical protein